MLLVYRPGGGGFPIGMILLYLVVIAIIGVHVYVSFLFGKIAKKKGYDGTKYTLLCVFLGLIGYLLVVALPDRGNKE